MEKTSLAKPMLNYMKAQRLIASLAKQFGKQQIALEDADGCILAEDIYADRDYPPFNRSAMDGYAIHTGDWENGSRAYKVQQVIYAGQTGTQPLQTGCCYKIMTGAPVPLSANTVIRREDAVEVEEMVTFSIDQVMPYQNIARQAEDAVKDALLVSRNTKCTPVVVSLLASVGKHLVQVHRQPRVALFTTGDELVMPQAPVAANQIRNSNRYLLKGLLKKWQISPLMCEHIKDDRQQLKTHLSAVLGFDIVITCGGVSAGDADYLPEVLENLGVKKLFHKVSVRPGKPIWCGQLPNGGLVFGLPGNPFSCMVGFKLFIETYLSESFGLGAPKTFSLPFKGSRLSKSGMDEVFPVKFIGNPSVAEQTHLNGSGDIRLGLGADALAIHPVNQPNLAEGTIITCYPL